MVQHPPDTDAGKTSFFSTCCSFSTLMQKKFGWDETFEQGHGVFNDTTLENHNADEMESVKMNPVYYPFKLEISI